MIAPEGTRTLSCLPTRRTMTRHQRLSQRSARLSVMLTSACAVLFVVGNLPAAAAHDGTASDRLRPCAILEIRAATDESLSADQREQASRAASELMSRLLSSMQADHVVVQMQTYVRNAGTQQRRTAARVPSFDAMRYID